MTRKIYAYRHIFKAVTWRILASTTTLLVSWWITGSWELGAGIMSIEAIAKMGLYYVHERAWYNCDFGLEKRDDG
jgi:uncharacterized membrane protein